MWRRAADVEGAARRDDVARGAERLYPHVSVGRRGRVDPDREVMLVAGDVGCERRPRLSAVPRELDLVVVDLTGDLPVDGAVLADVPRGWRADVELDLVRRLHRDGRVEDGVEAREVGLEPHEPLVGRCRRNRAGSAVRGSGDVR